MSAAIAWQFFPFPILVDHSYPMIHTAFGPSAFPGGEVGNYIQDTRSKRWVGFDTFILGISGEKHISPQSCLTPFT